MPRWAIWIARHRKRCRDTEFSKQKYRNRGIFRKFVVAGEGIRSTLRVCAQICSYSNFAIARSHIQILNQATALQGTNQQSATQIK